MEEYFLPIQSIMRQCFPESLSDSSTFWIMQIGLLQIVSDAGIVFCCTLNPDDNSDWQNFPRNNEGYNGCDLTNADEDVLKFCLFWNY